MSALRSLSGVYGQMLPTSWDDALDLVARIIVGVINDMGEDGGGRRQIGKIADIKTAAPALNI
jgi:hypothetical protein